MPPSLPAPARATTAEAPSAEAAEPTATAAESATPEPAEAERRDAPAAEPPRSRRLVYHEREEEQDEQEDDAGGERRGLGALAAGGRHARQLDAARRGDAPRERDDTALDPGVVPSGAERGQDLPVLDLAD